MQEVSLWRLKYFPLGPACWCSMRWSADKYLINRLVSAAILYLQGSYKNSLYYYLGKKGCNSSLSSNTFDKNFPLDSHLTSVCWKSHVFFLHTFTKLCKCAWFKRALLYKTNHAHSYKKDLF
jgi:hypothetical protein